ncbi:hypothetical protein ACH5RR_015140 [Cinchona calisaya]|uniref:Uncharacterized protein n=1 Tax=Cinchona calisaya TaxID=153742 RepID=A0ABD2ZSA8_9GENT
MGAVKLADYGNTTNPSNPNSVNAKKRSNLSNYVFFQGGKQMKVKAKKFSSNGYEEKNFKRTGHYKGLFPKSSPKTEHNISFTDLTNQTADPNDTQVTRVAQPKGIFSNTQTKEEVSLIDISKKMVTNLGTEADKFSRDFIIGSFQAIVKLMTSSDLSEF